MCGIAGTLSFEGRLPDDTVLAQAASRLAARGPDGQGAHSEPGLGLVHRRLAIIDLSERGAQPMAVDGGRLRLVFNGEIYNYRELRDALRGRHAFRSDSDSEVLLRLYDEHADDPAAMLRGVRGMFAFALWDARRRRLLLARDRFGIKPLFLHESSAGISFASTLDALAAFPGVERRLDWTSLFDQLSLLTPPGPHTFLAGVRQLEPGTALVVAADGASRLHRYWSLTIPPSRDLDEEAATRTLDQRLSESLRLHMVADVEVGAFLSGGLDSGLVTAYAMAAAGRPLQTFSAAFPGDPVDESPWASETARRLGTVHSSLDVGGTLLDDFESVVAAMDQPLGLLSAVPLYRLARAASRQVKVVLTGDGGDEVLAGYPRHRPLGELPARVAWMPRALRGPASLLGSTLLPVARAWLGPRADHAAYLVDALGQDPAREYLFRLRVLPAPLALGLLRAEAREQVDTRRHERRVRDLWSRPEEVSPLHRMLAVDLQTSLVDEMMPKADRMTMAWGLEGRVPLLDHELVEASLAVAAGALRQGSTGKIPLRRLARRWLGNRTAERPKSGFNTSFARDLHDPGTRSRVDGLFEGALACGLFDRRASTALRARAETGDRASGHALFALLSAGEWARQRGLRP